MATSDKQQERITTTIGRVILLIIGIVFIVYMFVKQPCNGIDDEYLSCRIKGTWGDWIGVPAFLFGIVWLSGILKGLNNLTNPPGSSKWNYIWFAGMILGVVLFWTA